jgi:hypothetical protein
MENKIENFCAMFCPFGYRDIEVALQNFAQVQKNEQDLKDAVYQFHDDTAEEMENIDVCYVAYDTIYQEARIDIEKATGKDICNDEPYSGVSIYGNYMCTELTADGNEDFIALLRLIETIDEKDRTLSVKWLYQEVSDKI